MSQTTKLNVGLVGAGKVGVVLTAALAHAGHNITAVWDQIPAALASARQTLGEFETPTEPGGVRIGNDVVILAVPDDALAGLAEELALKGGQDWHGTTVIHVSGRYGVAVLDPLAACGASPVAIHPAMAFSGDRDTELQRIIGARFAVTAPDAVQDLAESLVSDMGGIPFAVAEDDRVLYHAAMAHASNHLVTLMVQSMSMLSTVGVDDPPSVIGPAVAAALENVLQRGFAGATGPVVRGDVGTIRGHLRAIGSTTPSILDSYRVLSESTADHAVQVGRLPEGPYTEIMTELQWIPQN